MTNQTGLSAAQFATPSVANLLATTPKMAACSGCHQTDLAISHMEQMGGSRAITKDAEGRWTPGTGAAAETCMICHGPGALADIKVMHGITP
jgi:hypothetical protein